MKYLTLYTVFAFGLLLTSARPANADDNIAACEIVVMQPVFNPQVSDNNLDQDSDGQTNETTDSPMIATFLPAGDFLFSVFDTQPGFINTVNGHPIRAVMCTRSNVIPTEFDIKIIRTDIPLHLSQNFDSVDSALMSILKRDGAYIYKYTGKELSGGDITILDLLFENLNTEVKLKNPDGEQ